MADTTVRDVNKTNYKQEIRKVEALIVYYRDISDKCINNYNSIKEILMNINNEYSESNDTSLAPYVIEENTNIIAEIDRVVAKAESEKTKVIDVKNREINLYKKLYD